MLALTVIPLALYARNPCHMALQAGFFRTFRTQRPRPQKVLLPLIRRIGSGLTWKYFHPGYVPKGHGRLAVSVNALKQPLKPLDCSGKVV